jgi:hypothetical protein
MQFSETLYYVFDVWSAVWLLIAIPRKYKGSLSGDDCLAAVSGPTQDVD